MHSKAAQAIVKLADAVLAGDVVPGRFGLFNPDGSPCCISGHLFRAVAPDFRYRAGSFSFYADLFVQALGFGQVTETLRLLFRDLVVINDRLSDSTVAPIETYSPLMYSLKPTDRRTRKEGIAEVLMEIATLVDAQRSPLEASNA